MKIKITALILLVILTAGILCTNVFAYKDDHTIDEIEYLIDGIVAWKQNSLEADSVDDLINIELAESAGASSTDWYIIALSQYKYDYRYDGYVDALNRYVLDNTAQKATDLQRIALAFSAVGNNDTFINDTISRSVGELGIMSYIYGLILLDSNAYENERYTREDIIDSIISLRLPDGGWALNGENTDIDITAMAIQALAPYYTWEDVKEPVDKALMLLSDRQLENGDYSSWGTRNPETTAQVICALIALKIDPQKDVRFIKNENTLLDGLLLYKLPDGSFSHTLEGNSNNAASVQALSSLISIWRQNKNKTSLYIFNSKTLEDTVKTDIPVTETQVMTGSVSTSVTETESTQVSDKNGSSSSEDIRKGSGKTIAYIIIAVVALFAILFLQIIKKKNIKNVILVLAVTIAAILVVFFIKIQSVEDYYLIHIDDIKADSQTVSISIRCDTAVGKIERDYIPDDGIILEEKKYVLRQDDTVFDVLLRAAKHNEIQMEYEGQVNGILDTVYIIGINYLYEMDCGELSGWNFRVNGEFSGIGCADYVLNDGDKIEWLYTCDLGKDVGRK